MAHIADFMVDTPSRAGLNNHTARELSPHSKHDGVSHPVFSPSVTDGYIGPRSSPNG
jgi:hypothetical protein